MSNSSINNEKERHNNNEHVEPSSTTTAPTPLARTMPTTTTPFNYAPIHRSVTEPRRQCARNLLRRSSAYLRAKFKTTICDQDDNNHHRDVNVPFNKGQDHLYATIQPSPPVVTQYPPKPLKYSPVEPIEDDILGNNYPTRKWFPLKMNRS